MVTTKYIQIQLILNSIQGGGKGEELDGTKGGHGGGGGGGLKPFSTSANIHFFTFMFIFYFPFHVDLKTGCNPPPLHPFFFIIFKFIMN